MDAIEVADLVAEPVGVDFRMLSESSSDRLQHDVVERHLELVAEGGHRAAHFGDALHVEFGRQIEGRDRPNRLGQPAGDRLPDLRERDIAEVIGRVWCATSDSANVRSGIAYADAGGDRGLDVALDDASAGPAPLNRLKVESTFR